HLRISSVCFYRISNRHTFSEIFQTELWSEEFKQRHKAMICDAVLRYLKR
ncbi:TetR/AcrR family transcriptional regulator, partial [Pseudomonas syringae]|nr:TetR/AcrR family transcriptional regulator [Pseudomonas syringae]